MATDVERMHKTVVKYGDTILLGSTVAGQGFVSCSQSLNPQVRAEVLLEGVSLPPQVMDCRFEIHNRNLYTERDNFMAVLRECGINATDEDNNFDDQVFMTGTFEDVVGVMDRLQLNTARKNKIKHGKADYEKEQAVNASELNRFMGTHLLYGQAIQLMHTSTGLYVSVKKTASEVDRGALKLQLTDGNQAAWFTITSGLRTASDGEHVKFGDSVSLMSTVFPGMGLHQSSLPITQPRMLPVKSSECIRQTMEVSCSPTVGRFQVVPHALARTLLSQEANHLMGCSAVQLARRSANKLIVCDRGIVSLEDDFSIVSTPATTIPSSPPPGHAVWSLQPAKLEWAGMPCRFRRAYRLLHTLSDTYLAAASSSSGDYVVHVNGNYADPSTIWILHSFGQQGAEISEEEDGICLGEESHVLLQHATSQAWLTAGKLGGTSMAASEKQRVPLNLDQMRRDDELICVTVVPSSFATKVENMQDCLLVMQRFNEDLRDIAKHRKPDETVYGLDAPLEAVAKACMASGLADIFADNFPRVEAALATVTKMMSEENFDSKMGVAAGGLEGSSVAMYQRLAKESHLIETIVSSLDAINMRMLFGPGGQEFTRQYMLGSQLISFGTLSHRVLQCACKGNVELQNHVSMFEDKLKKHLGGPVKAADTLAAIYHVNMERIQSANHDTMDSFIGLIRSEGRMPRFLNFLQRLSGSADRPVPRNQNLLAQKLLTDTNVELALVKAGSAGSGDWEISCVSRTGTKRSFLCRDLLGYPDDDNQPDISTWSRSEEFIRTHPEKALFIYYIYSLELFCSLCYGRNGGAQQDLQAASAAYGLGLEFDALVQMINNKAVPFVLRATCAKLLLYVYVDADPRELIKLPRTVRLLGSSEHAAGHVIPAEKKQESDKLASELHIFFQEFPTVECTNGQFSLLKTVVQLAAGMLSFGMVQLGAPTTLGILRSMFRILRTDYKRNSLVGWEVLMEAKAGICRVLSVCLDLETESNMSTLFTEFEKANGFPSPPLPDGDFTVNSGLGDEERLIEGEKGISHDGIDLKGVLAKVTNSHLSTGCDIFRLDPILLNEPTDGPVMPLLELLRCGSTPLTEEAMKLVNRLLGKRRKLVQAMLNTFIVVDIDTALMTRRCSDILSELATEFQSIASTDEQRKQAATDRCKRLFQELSSTLVVGGTLTIESKVVILTKPMVQNFQVVLSDLRAHETSLMFLKLPLRRKAQPLGPDGRKQLDLAEDLMRREVFGAVYEFLERFAATELPNGDIIHNTTNQGALVHNLDIFMSHTGVLNLNVASTIGAMFKCNPPLVRQYLSDHLLRRFSTLLVDFGGKERTRFFKFLRTAVVVNGTPVPKNQSEVLTLAACYEDSIIELFLGEEGHRERQALMKVDDHIVNTESGAIAKGSRLAYHRECLLLLADCSMGGEPTLVVKANGFLSLNQVLDGAALPHDPQAYPATTTRFVTSAYWRFLQHVYFASDTENTREAATAPNNGIWKSSRDGAKRAATPLIHVALFELDCALGGATTGEPPNTLAHNIKYTATQLLYVYVFPALAEYFGRHYQSHLPHLPKDHVSDFDALLAKLKEFWMYLIELDPHSEHVRCASEKRAALKSTKALLEAMLLHSPDNDAFNGVESFEAPTVCSTSTKGSTHRSKVVSEGLAVQSKWAAFTEQVASAIGVIINPMTRDCGKTRPVERGGEAVSMASLHILARLFAQPHMQPTKPDGKNENIERRRMSSNTVAPLSDYDLNVGKGTEGVTSGEVYEELTLRLCKFLVEEHDKVQWPEEMLVKTIRALRFSVYIHDGHGDPNFIKAGWKAGIGRENMVHFSSAHREWAQGKCAQVGFAEVGVALMANPKLPVQLEAVRLLIVLLEEGNKEVQELIHEALTERPRRSESWFASLRHVFDRCTAFVADMGVAGKEDESREVWGEDEDEKGRAVLDTTLELNESGNAMAFAKDVMLLLRLMNEGHFRPNQLLMRCQPRNNFNTDVVAASVKLLSAVQDKLLDAIDAGNSEVHELMVAVLEFLTEASQGPCYPIQSAVINGTNFVLMSNRTFGYIILEAKDDISTQASKCVVLKHMVGLLYALLEGNPNETLAERIDDVLDHSCLKRQAESLLSAYSSLKELRVRTKGDFVRAAKKNVEMKGMRQSNGDRGSSGLSLGDVEEALRIVQSTLQHLIFFLKKMSSSLGRSAYLGGPNGDNDNDDGVSAMASGTPRSSRSMLMLNIEEFMNESSDTVELLSTGEQLEKVYFPLTAMSRLVKQGQYLKQVSQMVEEVSAGARGNPLEKAMELLDRCELAVLEMERNIGLEHTAPWLSWIVRMQSAILQLSFYLALLSLTIMVFTVRTDVTTWLANKDDSYWACVIISLVQILLTCLVGVSFVAYDFRKWQAALGTKARGARLVEWNEQRTQRLGARDNLARQPSGTQKNKTVKTKRGKRKQSEIMIGSAPAATVYVGEFSNCVGVKVLPTEALAAYFADEFSRPPQKPTKTSKLVASLSHLGTFLDLLAFWRAWFIAALLVTAVLAVIASPFWVTAHLTIYFLEFEAGQTVGSAVLVASVPMIRTASVALLTMFVFSVVSMTVWKDPNNWGYRSDYGDEYCTTMYQCAMTHFLDGLGGGIEGLLGDGDPSWGMADEVPEHITDVPNYQMRTFFMALYGQIIWGMIVGNIFTGYIVEAFAALREERKTIREDNMRNCLVCSLERFAFDQDPRLTFEKHVAEEHNPLSYVYYLHYLKNTPRNDFKGYDTAVNAMLKKESPADRVAWLPVSRSLAIEKGGANSSKTREKADSDQTEALESLRRLLQRIDGRTLKLLVNDEQNTAAGASAARHRESLGGEPSSQMRPQHLGAAEGPAAGATDSVAPESTHAEQPEDERRAGVVLPPISQDE